jgi:hypothetical protein
LKYDPEQDQIRAKLLIIGQTLLPNERNVGKLLQAASASTGIHYQKVSSKIANHLPTPEETGPYYLCPSCFQIKMTISELCPGCTQSEGGKYLTQTHCIACGEFKKFSFHLGELYNHLGIDFKSSPKAELGVKLILREDP